MANINKNFEAFKNSITPYTQKNKHPDLVKENGLMSKIEALNKYNDLSNTKERENVIVLLTDLVNMLSKKLKIKGASDLKKEIKFCHTKIISFSTKKLPPKEKYSKTLNFINSLFDQGSRPKFTREKHKELRIEDEFKNTFEKFYDKHISNYVVIMQDKFAKKMIKHHQKFLILKKFEIYKMRSLLLSNYEILCLNKIKSMEKIDFKKFCTINEYKNKTLKIIDPKNELKLIKESIKEMGFKSKIKKLKIEKKISDINKKNFGKLRELVKSESRVKAVGYVSFTEEKGMTEKKLLNSGNFDIFGAKNQKIARDDMLLKSFPCSGGEEVEPNQRTTDVEYLFLNDIALKFKGQNSEQVSGTINILVSLPPCNSCIGTLCHLKKLYPKLKIYVGVASKIRTALIEAKNSHSSSK